MGARILLLAAGLLVAFVAFRQLRSCGRTPEDRIRETIRAIAEAAEEKDAGAIVERIAPDYHDAEGLTRAQLHIVLLARFREHRGVSVGFEGPIEVRLQPGGTAVAVLYARLAESALEGFARRGELVRFEVELRKADNDEWRVVSHRRERADSR